MTIAHTLLIAALALPFTMLFACLSAPVRDRMPSLLAFAPLPALAAAFLAVDNPLSLSAGRMTLSFALDLPGAIILGTAAALWSAAGAYASAYMPAQSNRGRFTVCWLTTLTGCIGVFVSGDLVSFYLALALLSLGAYGLVVHDGTPRAERAGAIYVGLALFAEALVLMAFVMLAAGMPNGSLSISDAVSAVAASPQRDLIIALLIVGFGMKAGLAPLHFWIPIAHAAAPTPASAVLSGAVVMAGVLGLIRFLPLGVALSEWGITLVIAGLFTAFYGVALGITQINPKSVLAYSTVSQMGFIIAVLGLGLDAGNAGVALAAAFYAGHHALVKGALFLAIGVAATTGRHRLWLILAPAAIIALGLGGLPLTGGALAKYAVKDHFGDGLTGTLAMLSAAGTTLVMLHFLRRLALTEAKTADGIAPPALTVPWLALAFAAIAAPWALYLALPIGTAASVIAISTIGAAMVAVLIGGMLAVALQRWGGHLPQVPEGDIAFVLILAARLAARWSDAFERTDTFLRRWPVACVSLLSLVIVFCAAFVAASR
jgi:multicomponent Na+:H+ antiporter subunit A